MISSILTVLAVSLVPAMVEVPAGRFYMGAEGVTADYNADEGPIHRVEITRPFLMSAFEVTNAEYELFDPSHRDLRGRYGFSKEDDEAVVFVNWDDAMAYCRWLSEQDGKTYRLPTEAEWEYACRAGSMSAYSWGGVFRDDMSKNNVPGAEEKMLFEPLSLASLNKRPNAFGLYDMHGNVEEWCLDWYGPYLSERQTDPVGPSDGDFRVTRGGSHTTSPTYLRSTNRSAMPQEDRSFAVGFRIVQAEYPSAKPYSVGSCFREKKVSGRTVRWKQSSKAVFCPPVQYVKPAQAGVRMFRHNHEPAICWCPNGDLLAIWFSTASEFDREMVILYSRLPYRSTEWTAPREFFKIPDRNMTGLSLFYDRYSESIIHLSGYDALGWWRNEAVVMRRSYDNGLTWTKPRVVMPDHEPGHQIIAGMSRMPDGTLVQMCDAGPGGEDGSAVHLSADNGDTWIRTAADAAGIHAGCVGLIDGSLMAFGRTKGVPDEAGTMKMPVSVSFDRGDSWTVSPSGFSPIRGGQRLVLMRLQEGPILLVSFLNDGNPWKGMYASLSYDEGNEWTEPKLLTDGSERCLDGGAWTGTFVMDSTHAEPKGYLAATQSPDGFIHLISSKNYYKFNLKWLEQ